MTGEPGVPQSMGSQIVRRDLATEQQQQHCTPQLGKGEDSGVSRSCCVPEARTCCGCGQCGGRESGSRGPGVPPQTAGLPGLGETARRESRQQCSL